MALKLRADLLQDLHGKILQAAELFFQAPN